MNLFLTPKKKYESFNLNFLALKEKKMCYIVLNEKEIRGRGQYQKHLSQSSAQRALEVAYVPIFKF